MPAALHGDALTGSSQAESQPEDMRGAESIRTLRP